MSSGLTSLRNSDIGLRGIVTISLVVFCLIAASVLGILTHIRFGEIEDAWLVANEQHDNKIEELAAIQTQVGYGGYIHDFKNFVLRNEVEVHERLHDRIEKIHETFERFRDLELNDLEKAALNTIEKTFDEYARQEVVVEEMRKTGASAEYIDSVVRVDDRDALIALQVLHSEAIRTFRTKQKAMQNAAVEAHELIDFGLFLMPFPILIAFLAIPFMSDSIRRLRDQEQVHLRDVIENFPGGIGYYGDDDRLVFCNSKYAMNTTQREKELVGRTFEELFRSNVEAGAYVLKSTTKEAFVEDRLRNRTKGFNALEFELTNGKWAQVRDFKTKGGGTATITFDITDRVELQNRFQLTQRMESIGKLTGGIAHDFNNILHVINGNAQLIELSSDLTKDEASPTARRLQNITKAVGNGASLTKHLLAFARRDSLTPVTIDVNDKIRASMELLNRTIATSIDIRLTAGSGNMKANLDPNQFENAIINFSINSRDAMPDGGTINISTELVSGTELISRNQQVLPDQNYVMVSIKDTGQGIASESIDKIFEPFFTTKEQGKGSGLGLSMIYGFVQQSGGFLEVSSEVDVGTEFRMFFPQSNSSDETVRIEQESEDFCPCLKTGRVLVVEDDPMVKDIPVTMLEECGFDVVSVSDANDALQILMSPVKKFDLLFTDIMLPGGMNGIELAAAAKVEHPDLKILYTSGYTEKFANPDHDLNLGSNLLRKPYSRSALINSINELLDESAL